MAKVSRNYQHQDFSDLLKELNTQNIEKASTPGKQSSGAASKQTVSAARRHRSSLMDNRNMKFIISKSTGLAHDRDCPIAASIPDEDFDMLPDFPVPPVFCTKCYRKALIRKSLDPGDGKRIEAYMNIFRILKVRTVDLQKLTLNYHAKLYDVALDRVYLKVNEDKWYLQPHEDGCLLYHNSYINLENDRRLIVDSFHLQHEKPISFRTAMMEMGQYTWENHVRHKKAKQKAEAKAALLEKLSTTRTYAQLPRRSLFFTYYHYADSATYAKHIAKKQNFRYKIIMVSRYPNTNCIDVICRIPRWKKRKFQNILNQIKDCCVDGQQYDFADFCREKIRQT